MNLSIFTIKRYGMVLLLGAVLAHVTACKKWTEAKPLDIESQDLEQQNPALYAKYLEDLRAFKANPHKINMAWFNNSKKNPTSQGDHLSKVPDSLDFIVLESPLGLVDREVSEMKDLSEKKSTKVAFEVDFNSIKTAFIQKESKTLVFADFVKDTVDAILAETDKFPYQGVVVSYMGKDLTHLSPAERTQVETEENLFFDQLNPWLAKNTTKWAFFKGSPQYLLKKDILKQVKSIILPTDNVVDRGGLSYALLAAKVADVPTDKFVVLASMTSYKPDEAKLGYFADGSRAAISTAQWAASLQSGVQLQGVGYKNLPYDYFNVLKSYQYSRQAIQIINPAMKVK